VTLGRWFALSFVLFLLAGTRARAEGVLLEAACVTEADLVARLQPLLPASLTAAQALQRVVIRVRPVEAEHVAEIEIPARGDEPAMTRTVRGESCAHAVDAAVVVIGVWASSAPQPVAPAQPAPALPVAPPAPPPAQREAEAGEPILFGATLSAALANALLPRPALELEAGAVLGWRTLRLTLGARVWPKQSSEVRVERDIGVEAGLWEGVLRVAWQPFVLGPVELVPATALTVGELNADGVGLEASRPRSALWARSELELRARIGLLGSGFGVVAAFGGAVAWSRPEIVVGGEGTVFQPARLAPYGSLGFEALLP
jgi:hypothetical protein